MAIWPDSLLPDVLQLHNQEQRPASQRTTMTSNRTRQRKVHTKARRLLSVQWHFTLFEYDLFQAFFRYKIGKGADYFTIDLPFGADMVSVEARFLGGRYNTVYTENSWRVSATLDILDVPVMSAEDLEALLSDPPPMGTLQLWPIECLPDILLQYTQDTQGNINASESEGFVVQVGRFDPEIKQQAVRWIFTGEQFEIFQSFFEHRLNLGADYFRVDLPFEEGLQEVQARFVNGAYKASYQEPHWVVTATLEVEDVPTMTGEAYDFFVELNEDLELLETSADRLHVCVHEVLPSLFP